MAGPDRLADGVGPAALQPPPGRPRAGGRAGCPGPGLLWGSVSQPVVDDDRAALWTAIDALPEKLRVVIVLASIEGHDVREVAALLRVPEGTVKSRLFLARQRLKEALR